MCPFGPKMTFLGDEIEKKPLEPAYLKNGAARLKTPVLIKLRPGRPFRPLGGWINLAACRKKKNLRAPDARIFLIHAAGAWGNAHGRIELSNASLSPSTWRPGIRALIEKRSTLNPTQELGAKAKY